MIVAGIVTFEPELGRLRQNLAGIEPQVDHVLVYDNGSSNSAEVARLVDTFGGTFTSHPSNDGIAAALNRLADSACDIGARWLVTLDQDSVCPPGMVAELERIARTTAASAVCPFIVDRNKITVAEYEQMSLPEYEFFWQAARKGAITSGQLMLLDAWRAIGGFDDSFFIDYVDYDFNQRLLLAGRTIVRANRAHLLHEVGRARRTWLRVPRRGIDGRWQLERFHAFGHSAHRCYYKARNRILFTRKYGRQIGLTHEGVWQIPQQMALTVLFEQEKLRKAAAFMRGIRDGLRTPIEPVSSDARDRPGSI